MAGIDENGFTRLRLAEIKAEIEQELRSRLGNNLNLLPESVWGNLVGVFSEREDLLWQAAEDVYNSRYPSTSFGVSLDNVADLSGIVRLEAQPSQVNIRLFGTVGTNIPIGTQFSVNGSPESVFETTELVSLIAGQDAVQDIDFDTVPDAGTWRLNFRGQDTTNLAFDADAAAVQAALNALPFGAGISVSGDYAAGFTISFQGASGKQEQPLIVLDESTLSSAGPAVTVTITETTPGENQAETLLTAIATGPTIAPAGSLSVIDNPVAGLASVINVLDAVVGRNAEADNEFRLRRSQTLQVAGAGTIPAIRSRLLNLLGVTDAIIFENDSQIVDSDGRPPKSYEAIVGGGEQQAILDLLWETKPAGIKTVGSISGPVVDSQGQSQTLSFSRPTEVEIYLEIDLTVNSDFPANGIAAAQNALVARGNTFGIGKDVIVIPKLICALDMIVGIEGVVIRIGTSPGPVNSSNISIDANEISRFDTSRTQVVVV